MLRKIDWDSQVGRRLRLRDLHVFFTVAQQGSMGRAAVQLGVSAPTVSEVIADLEHGIGVRLFDRSKQGVEVTAYGRALLKRTITVFDELKQSIRDIEYLADAGTGELRIGCPDSIATTLLLHVVRRFSKKYPRVALHVDAVPFPAAEFPRLRDRTYDLILIRWLPRHREEHSSDDLNVEFLFDDPLIVAAAPQSGLARRRKIDFADLADVPWLLPADTWTYALLAEAFRERKLEAPKVRLVTMSVQIRADLLADGECVTMFPTSVANHYGLKALRVDFPVRPWPVSIITLRNRSLSPVAERFIDCVREVIKSRISSPASSPKRTAK
jgi:DNA-binding transcriptional LysR family regulator